MGRIEDAFQKLQQTVRSGGDAARTPSPSRLATLVADDHQYTGRRIHVNLEQLRKNGLLAPNTEERRLSEQYRAIKRPLLRNANPHHRPVVERGKLLMVASAFSGEGKTFTCLNLCLSIARERDWSVVLVDGDSNKPHLTRLFSAEKELGLVDLLRDASLTFDSLVMPTDVPGFSLLPAGSRDQHASELLASRRMDELCSSLAEDGVGRMIIFDSSPLLLTSEAAVLASKVGQVVFIVRANATPRQAVIAALEKIEPTKAVGCVLNAAYGAGLAAEHGEHYGDYYGESP